MVRAPAMSAPSAAPGPSPEFKPYVADDAVMPEFTLKAIVIGVGFGILFGAATVYLALKAGLTVSASIPIAVLAISLLRKLGGSTILENNIVQTIGSAGESIASGVVFTLPGFLFLAQDKVTGESVGRPYFTYWTIFTLALLGGALGVLMMIPLRRSPHRQGARHAPLPRGHRLRRRCSSPASAAGSWRQVAYSGVGLRLRLRAAAEGLPRHRRGAGAGDRADQQDLPLRHARRGDHP